MSTLNTIIFGLRKHFCVLAQKLMVFYSDIHHYFCFLNAFTYFSIDKHQNFWYCINRGDYMKKSMAEILRDLRASKKLTQGDLAKMLGLSTNAYQSYERGVSEPNCKALSTLADFYGVTTDYLLGRTDEKLNPIELLSDDEIEKKLLKAYFSLPSRARAEFLSEMAAALAEQEGIIQTVNINADQPTKSEKAIARSSDGSYRDVPSIEAEEKTDLIKPSPDF